MLGEAVVRLRADATGMASGINAARNELQSLKRTAESVHQDTTRSMAQTTQGFKGLTGVIQQTHGAALQLRSSILGVAAGIGAANMVARAFGAAKQAIIGFNSLQEQTLIGFKTMLGSQEAANKLMKDLQTFATKTPFEFQTLIGTAQQMMALGFQGKSLIPSLTAIGDAVAALGGSPEVLNRVTRALGQIQAKGKLSAEEMLQLAEAGIPAWKYVAQALGTDIPNAMKISEKQGIQSKIAINALMTGMEQDFGGMMKAQSKTLQGALSNIVDYVTQASARATKPLYTALQGAILDFATWMQGPQAKQLGEAIATGIGAAISTAQDALRMTATTIGPAVQAIVKAMQAAAPVAESLFDSFKSLGAVAGGVALGALKAVALAIQGIAIAIKPLIDFLASNRIAVMALVAAWLVFKAVHTGGWIDQITASITRMVTTTKTAGASSLGFLTSLTTAWKTASTVSRASATEISAATAMVTETQSGLAVVRNFAQAEQGAGQAAGVFARMGAVAGTAGLAMSNFVPVLGTIAVTAGMIGVTKWMEDSAKKAQIAKQAIADMQALLEEFPGQQLASPAGTEALAKFIQLVKEGELKETGKAVGLSLHEMATGFESVATGADKGVASFMSWFQHMNDDIIKGMHNRADIQFGEILAEGISKSGYMGARKAMSDSMDHLSGDALKKMKDMKQVFAGSRVLQSWTDEMIGKSPEDIRKFLVSMDDLLATQLKYGRNSKEVKEQAEQIGKTFGASAFASTKMAQSIDAVANSFAGAGYAITAFNADAKEGQDAVKEMSKIFSDALSPMKRLDFKDAIGLEDFTKNLFGNLDDVRQWADQLNFIVKEGVTDPGLARDTADYFRQLGVEGSAKLVDEFVKATPERRNEIAGAIRTMLDEAGKLSPLQAMGGKFVNVDEIKAALRAGLSTISIADMIGIDRTELQNRLKELDPEIRAWADRNDAVLRDVGNAAGNAIIDSLHKQLMSSTLTGDKIEVTQFMDLDPMKSAAAVKDFFQNMPEGTFDMTEGGAILADQLVRTAKKVGQDISKGIDLGPAQRQFQILFETIDKYRKGKPLAEMFSGTKEEIAEAEKILKDFISGDYKVTIKTNLDNAFAESQLAALIEYISNPKDPHAYDVLATVVTDKTELAALIAAAKRGEFDVVTQILTDPTIAQGVLDRYASQKPAPIPVPIEPRLTRSHWEVASVLGGVATGIGAIDISANGKILRFAQGGENHIAQIARPGTMRLWNEPETGGEAYIPMAMAKRNRSVQILRDVAQDFGYNLAAVRTGHVGGQHYADGGIVGGMGGAASGGFTLMVQDNVYGDEAFKKMMKNEVDKRDRRSGIDLARKGR